MNRILVWIAIAIIALLYSSASQAKSTELQPCPPVGQAGNIIIYWCELEGHEPFFQNSNGFMLKEE